MQPTENTGSEFRITGRGIQYLLKLARYPERPLEPRSAAYAKALGRALRRMGVAIAGKGRAREGSKS